jgi:hypothetical protein
MAEYQQGSPARALGMRRGASAHISVPIPLSRIVSHRLLEFPHLEVRTPRVAIVRELWLGHVGVDKLCDGCRDPLMIIRISAY